MTELKVRVDGIPRVVCGVTQQTTCQDVVRALAVATSQVGRFTLIEKFRNNERFLSPGERPIQLLAKWGEYANDVQFVLKRFCDSLNNNQLLTEQQHKLSLRNGHRSDIVSEEGKHMLTKEPESRAGRKSGDRPSPAKERAENGLISPQSCLFPDAQPVTRPKHPPSYDSVTRSIFHHSPTASHSSPKKRTSQETVTKENTSRDGDEEVRQQQPLKLSGKRQNSHTALHAMVPATDPPAQWVADHSLVGQQGVRVSHSSDPEDHSGDRKQGLRSSCWQADLQEIRIKDEYDRKKLEKDQLLVKASGLEAEIAVCRQKIQLLSDQIREEEHSMERDALNLQQEEAKGKESLDRLREQIVQCESDLQRQKRESEEVQTELRQLEETLRSKYEEMESVLKEIRKENLNALNAMEVPASSVLRNPALTSSSASPFLKLHSEVMRHNQSLLTSRFYNRIGSTRKMLTSPRDLETAVATNKNPHGVWV